MQIGSPLHIPPIANPRFAGFLQTHASSVNGLLLYGLLSAGDVFLTDLTNAILLVCLAVGDAIHWFTRHRNSLHLNLQFRLFPLLELLDLLLGELCSSSKSALAALRYRSRSYLLRWL